MRDCWRPEAQRAGECRPAPLISTPTRAHRTLVQIVAPETDCDEYISAHRLGLYPPVGAGVCGSTDTRDRRMQRSRRRAPEQTNLRGSNDDRLTHGDSDLKVLTDSDIEAFASDAEQAYDVPGLVARTPLATWPTPALTALLRMGRARPSPPLVDNAIAAPTADLAAGRCSTACARDLTTRSPVRDPASRPSTAIRHSARLAAPNAADLDFVIAGTRPPPPAARA